MGEGDMYYGAGGGANKRLICFPFEGGSSHIFKNWADALKDHVEVVAVELPGRGKRIREKLYYRLPELIHELIPSILEYLDKPFYFFGHGMGALISFEMTQALSRNFLPEPDHIFVSGYAAPCSPIKEPLMCKLPKSEFLDKLKEKRLLPAEVLKDDNLLDLMYPILKADFSVCETYSYKVCYKTACGVTAFGGLADDTVGYDELQEWAEVTNSSFELNLLPGSHFFILNSRGMFLKILSEKLSFYNEGVKP